MHIDWTTVIFELVNFALLVLIMLRFVFRPVRRILDERKAAIVAHEQRTAAREAEAKAIETRYQAALEQIDAQAERRLGEALIEARAEAERIVGEGRSQARAEIDKAEAEVARSRTRTLERFRDEILRLGTEAARRVVRELGAPEVGEAFAKRAVHALQDSLGAATLAGPLEAQISPELDPAAIEALLRRSFGATIELRVEQDEALIGGVRLHGDGREVEASAGASLAHWYRGLLRPGEEGA